MTTAESSGAPLSGSGGGSAASADSSSEDRGLRIVARAHSEHSDRLQRIIETQRDIATADLDLQAIMQLVCERTQELTNADGGTILIRDGDELVHRAGTGFIADKVGQRLGMNDTFSGEVYHQNRSAICNDTSELANPLARQRGIMAMIAVPLRHGDRTVGLVSVLSKTAGVFTEEDLGTLELLSVVLSAAISHAAELEARRDQVEALGRFRTFSKEPRSASSESIRKGTRWKQTRPSNGCSATRRTSSPSCGSRRSPIPTTSSTASSSFTS